MLWICSVCGMENSTNASKCKECKSQYGMRQANRTNTAKLRLLDKRTSETFDYKVEPIDPSKIDWSRPVTLNNSIPDKESQIGFLTKIASGAALACIIFSVLLLM